MREGKLPDFIAIDDDRIDNMISFKMIKQNIPDANVQTFTSPETGLEYIQLEYCKNEDKKAILFLDINMPTLNGWEVLERLKFFPDLMKAHVRIFILSSSVNPIDKEMADNNPLVSGFIQKPLTKISLEKVLQLN